MMVRMLPFLATGTASDAARAAAETAANTAAQQAAYFTALNTLAAVSAALLVAAILAITLRSAVRSATQAGPSSRLEGAVWAALLAGFPIVSLVLSLLHILGHANTPEGLPPSDLGRGVWWIFLLVLVSVSLLTGAYAVADDVLSTSNPRLNPVQSTAKTAKAAQQAAAAAAKAADAAQQAAAAAAKAAQQCAAAADTARPAAGGQRRPWGRLLPWR